jgi:hypothetical protein
MSAAAPDITRGRFAARLTARWADRAPFPGRRGTPARNVRTIACRLL